MIACWYHIVVVLSAIWMPAMRAMGEAADVPWGLKKAIEDVTQAEKDVTAFHKYLGLNKLQMLPDLYNKLVWQTLKKLQDDMQNIEFLDISAEVKIDNRDTLQKTINDINDIKWGNYKPPGSKPAEKTEPKKEEKTEPKKEEKTEPKKEEKKEVKGGQRALTQKKTKKNKNNKKNNKKHKNKNKKTRKIKKTSENSYY